MTFLTSNEIRKIIKLEDYQERQEGGKIKLISSNIKFIRLDIYRIWNKIFLKKMKVSKNLLRVLVVLLTSLGKVFISILLTYFFWIFVLLSQSYMLYNVLFGLLPYNQLVLVYTTNKTEISCIKLIPNYYKQRIIIRKPNSKLVDSSASALAIEKASNIIEQAPRRKGKVEFFPNNSLYENLKWLYIF